MSRKRHFFDKCVERVISRKFLAWVVATTLLLISAFTKFLILKSEDWVIITAIYIGGQAVVDIFTAIKGNKSSTITNVLQNVSPNTNKNNNSENKTVKEIKKDPSQEKDTSKDRPTSFGGTK